MSRTKYVFVTGGVVSSLGKGITAASLGRLLKALEAATKPAAMDLPGLRFHALKGEDKGRFAVWASENWRLTFAWDGADAIEVDLEDYH